MADIERLSWGALVELTDRLVRRVAEPDEVHQILREFVAYVSAGESVPEPLLRCLQMAFAGYLKQTYKTLDKAFRLIRESPARPRANPERETGIALAILAARVGNPALSHLDALEEISEQWGCDTTKAGDAWARRRDEAFDEFLLLRPLFGEAPLTAAEVKRARKLVSVADKRGHE
jgi:hypothetical protein